LQRFCQRRGIADFDAVNFDIHCARLPEHNLPSAVLLHKILRTPIDRKI
jgi:hypothetical protein